MIKLEGRDVSVSFGGVHALDRLNFAIEAGEIRGIIGPNGAGKTTLLNIICGITPPTSGDVRLDGSSIVGLNSSSIAARSVARTFQTSKMFKGMTVLENVMAGLHSKLQGGLLGAALGLRSIRLEDAWAAESAREMLDFVGMLPFADREATELSFGQQRLVEMARALVNEPTLLLLDEPAVGLTVERVGELEALLRRIRDQRGVTIVLIEHVIRLVMGVCDRITVLNSGRKIAEGSAEEVTSNAEVIEAYLGKALDAQRPTS